MADLNVVWEVDLVTIEKLSEQALDIVLLILTLNARYLVSLNL